MNANELAVFLNNTEFPICHEVVTVLRQQQAEIEALKKFNKAILKKGGFPYPLLTDEEINLIVFEIGITHIYDDPKRFARAILRKAQEK